MDRRTFVVTAALLSLVACERRTSAQDASSTTVAAVCPAADTGIRRTVASSRSTANLDTLALAIDKLDRHVGSATEAELTALLLARGRAKSEYHPEGGSPRAKYASAHPNEFHRYEPDNYWFYNGADFQELIRRFPTHELADDAGYALTLLPQGADCEGDVSCYIEYDWIRSPPDRPIARPWLAPPPTCARASTLVLLRRRHSRSRWSQFA